MVVKNLTIIIFLSGSKSDLSKSDQVDRSERFERPDRMTPLVTTTSSTTSTTASSTQTDDKRKQKLTSKKKDKNSKKQRKAQQRKERRNKLKTTLSLLRTGNTEKTGERKNKHGKKIQISPLSRSLGGGKFEVSHLFKNHQVHIRKKTYVESRQDRWVRIIGRLFKIVNIVILILITNLGVISDR